MYIHYLSSKSTVLNEINLEGKGGCNWVSIKPVANGKRGMKVSKWKKMKEKIGSSKQYEILLY